jgi:hypothetical protein
MPMMRQSQHQQRSVRRAMAIQLIINKELGLAKNENPIQGAFIIEELTDLVEAAYYWNLTESRNVVVFWVLWKPCTNVLKFKKKACIMKR